MSVSAEGNVTASILQKCNCYICTMYMYLCSDQLVIGSPVLHELVMSALLHDSSMLNVSNHVSILNSRQSMGDNN